MSTPKIEKWLFHQYDHRGLISDAEKQALIEEQQGLSTEDLKITDVKCNEQIWRQITILNHQRYTIYFQAARLERQQREVATTNGEQSAEHQRRYFFLTILSECERVGKK